MKPTLHTAANGHLTINLNDESSTYWPRLQRRLERELGFKRVGSGVLGMDEGIHPSFEGPEFRLLSGWDNWSGEYLLSESAAGDSFLSKLFDELEA
jgi:hypothetical protein